MFCIELGLELVEQSTQCETRSLKGNIPFDHTRLHLSTTVDYPTSFLNQHCQIIRVCVQISVQNCFVKTVVQNYPDRQFSSPIASTSIISDLGSTLERHLDRPAVIYYCANIFFAFSLSQTNLQVTKLNTSALLYAC